MTSVLTVSIGVLPPAIRICEIGVARGCNRASQTILAEWIEIMSRKAPHPNFDRTLDALRAHSFDVAPAAGAAGGALVGKYGAAAVLVAAEDAAAAFAVHPGVLIQGQVARLLDRGYQKFIKTSQFELPASASQLHTIHRFSEELHQLTGTIGLYNESLGTTSDLYEYDRLTGREAAQPAPPRPRE
jgi:hypothetical protein